MYSTEITTGRDFYFIVNTTSRSGHTLEIWKKIEQYLRENKISYQAVITAGAGHATELAHLISDMAFDKTVNIVVVGGDGTVNEVVNGLVNHANVRFGYIHTGSGNDLGRGLGLSNDYMELLRTVLTCKMVKPMDLGRVVLDDGSMRYFTISAGIGVDADVCKQALTSRLKVVLNKLKLGSLTYALLTVGTLFTMPIGGGHLTIDDGEEFDTDRIIFCAAMNHVCEGGGVPMAPSADAFDGKLSTCMFHSLSRIGCLVRFPLLLAKKHEKLKQAYLKDTSRIEVKLDIPEVIHADGEYCGTYDHVIFEIAPYKLNLIMDSQ